MAQTAVIGMRYDVNEVITRLTEVLVYGTAVFVEESLQPTHKVREEFPDTGHPLISGWTTRPQSPHPLRFGLRIFRAADWHPFPRPAAREQCILEPAR